MNRTRKLLQHVHDVSACKFQKISSWVPQLGSKLGTPNVSANSKVNSNTTVTKIIFIADLYGKIQLNFLFKQCLSPWFNGPLLQSPTITQIPFSINVVFLQCGQ